MQTSEPLSVGSIALQLDSWHVVRIPHCHPHAEPSPLRNAKWEILVVEGA
jgi:hypothetical protein